MSDGFPCVTFAGGSVRTAAAASSSTVFGLAGIAVARAEGVSRAGTAENATAGCRGGWPNIMAWLYSAIACKSAALIACLVYFRVR